MRHALGLLAVIVAACVVAALVAGAAIAAPGGQPFTVDVQPPDGIGRMFGDTWHVFLSGPLPPDARDLVEAACRDRGVPRRSAKVAFDCPGGDVTGAIRLGRLVRDLQWSTEVGRRGELVYMADPGACRGAAVLAYLGGWFRFLGEEDVLAFPPDLDTPGVRRYLDELGYGPALLERAAGVGEDALLHLTPAGWATLGIVNHGRLDPVWRLSTFEQVTALVGEQDSWRGFVRVVITCDEEYALLKFVFLGGEDADAVIAGITSHELILDGARSPFRVIVPAMDVEGWVNLIGKLNPEQVRDLRRASEIGYAGARIAPGIETTFTIPVGANRDLVDRYLATCGAGANPGKAR